MRTAIVGHRGVGKTSFLHRVQSYYDHEKRPVLCLDLDHEIEKRTGRTVRDIFATDGESAFRWLEIETFRAIDDETRAADRDVFLVFGGGFDPTSIPDSWRCLWLRRPTDRSGRIFIDRPRLDAGVTALEEFETRFNAREPRFAARSDEVIWLDEGLESSDEAECGFILGDLRSVGGAVTVMPSQFRRSDHFEVWARSRMNWGLKWFELRDDLLTAEQMEFAIRHLPDDRVLVSYRDPKRAEATAAFVERHALAFDWPVEFGPSVWGEPAFLSTHDRREGQSMTEALHRLSDGAAPGQVLKAALRTKDFDELKEAEEWRRADPSNRLFFPISPDGRWSWYRLWQGNGYSLNFVRDFEASAPDQPSLLQWARRAKISKPPSEGATFAAILGDPVAHSRTPMEQGAFFAASKNAPVLSIRVTEDEWMKGALEFLRSLGLRWASVTSPLKWLAYETCTEKDSVAQSLSAVNTLAWSEEGWRGANTDLDGFRELIENVKAEGLGDVAIWGGGGTLNVVRKILPDAEYFSIRTGENRDRTRISARAFSPQTVVWAVGRSKAVGDVPSSWKPKLVVDLNYSEDSPGREYAMKVGCRYVSGLGIFHAQAEAQRQFWEKS